MLRSMVNRCAACGLINGPTETACRRCKASFRAPAPVVDDDMPVLDIGAFAGASQPAREPPGQHYYFAHRALRDLMLSDPRALHGVMMMARDGVANDFLRRMWVTAADVVRDAGYPVAAMAGGPPEAVLLPDGLLVRMPPPTRMTDCFYMAILGTQRGVRYFTLEKAGPPMVEPCMLCEWTREVHANMGPFADTRAEAFLANVRARC